MKEATGELNLTVIVVIAVSLLVAFFYYAIWPGLSANFEQNAKCSKAVCENPCGTGSGKNVCQDMTEINKVKCKVKGSDTVIYCPWKG